MVVARSGSNLKMTIRQPASRMTISRRTPMDKLFQPFEDAIKEAHEAGMAAGNAVNPEPMHLTDGNQLFTVPDGPCGFAWVVVKPGGCSFARYMKKHHGARANYYGGMQVKW